MSEDPITSVLRFFTHRLSGSGPLSQPDIDAFAALIGPPRAFHKRDTIVEQGERSPRVWLIAEGWAFRQKMLKEGQRQITAIMLPGELTEKGLMMPFGAGDSVVAVTDLTARPIERKALEALLEARPKLMRSLFYEELTRHAVTREWLLLLGKRRATERLAYFYYETYARLNAMGMMSGSTFDLPLGQQEVADLVGLSLVHVNRSLQTLRSMGLIAWTNRTVELKNPPALSRLAGFNEEMIRIAQEFAVRAKSAETAAS